MPSKKHMEELARNHQMDVEQMLLDELTGSINRSIINTLMFDSKVSEIKALNRQGRIDSILGDGNDEFICTIIEETKEYKMLSKEDKEKYGKYGKILGW